MEQSSLILKRRRLEGRLIPLVLERLRIAEHLVKVLTQLGLERRAPKAVALHEYLAARYGGAEGEAPPAPAPPASGPATAPAAHPASPPEPTRRRRRADEAGVPQRRAG